MERVVSVELNAKVNGFLNSMSQARQGVKDLNQEITRQADKNPVELGRIGQAFTAVGLAAAAASGLAIAKWASFDQQMSAVQAATHETEGSMRLLEAAALDAGGRTVFSANEAANAIEELAKAGVETADILDGGLDGALDLAAAGGLGVAEAAGIAATALKTFKLEGSDMGHVADLLAAGAGKAMGDVTDLSAALNQSSMVANATGLSIEETTAALAAFASQGLLGSDAGTSFKTMLMALTKESGPGAEKMRELGISAYDAQGKFVGLAEFAGSLRTALAGMTDEQRQATLATIFGTDAIRAATVLYSEGEDGIREWTAAVDDQGYAAETAAARLDNLMGDLEALGGALDTALIQTGSGANDVLRGMVQLLTAAVDAYTELPAPLQGALLGVGLLTAGVGLLGGAFIQGTIKAAEFRTAIATIAPEGGKMRAGLGAVGSFLGGPWGVALTAAALALHTLNSEIQAGVPSQAELKNSLLTTADAADLLATAADRGKVETFFWGDYSDSLKDLPKLLDDATAAGWRWGELTFNQQGALDSISRLGDALAEVASTDLSQAQAQFKNLADSQGLSSKQATQLLEEMPAFRDALIEQATQLGLTADDATLLQLALGEIGPAAKDGADGADSQASSLEDLAGVASQTTEDIATLAEEIRNFGAAQFDVERTALSFNDALRELQEQMESGEATWDITTEAGSRTRKALVDLASETNNYAAALAANGEAVDVYAGVLDAGRQKLYETALALTGSEEQARAYADALIATPESVSTYVDVNTGDAAAALAELQERIPTDKVVQISADAVSAFEDIDGVNTVQIDDKVAYVYGETDDANAKITEVIGRGIPGKSAVISANDSSFWEAWFAIQRAEMATKVVNIVEQVTSSARKNANGGIYAYADGGMASGIYAGRAGALYKFAEPETRWEAFISGKPGMEARNTAVWADAGERLGVMKVLRGLLQAPQQAGVQIGQVTLGGGATRQEFRDLEDSLDRFLRRG